jgi:hypothetical protein
MVEIWCKSGKSGKNWQKLAVSRRVRSASLFIAKIIMSMY